MQLFAARTPPAVYWDAPQDFITAPIIFTVPSSVFMHKTLGALQGAKKMQLFGASTPPAVYFDAPAILWPSISTEPELVFMHKTWAAL